MTWFPRVVGPKTAHSMRCRGLARAITSLSAVQDGNRWTLRIRRFHFSTSRRFMGAQAPTHTPAKKRQKRNFTTEEDRIITTLRSKRTSWPKIKLGLPHRSVSSLRQRWENYLRPDSDFEREELIADFTPSEEEKLSRLKGAGRSWFEIKKEFPDRYFHALQAHWNFKLKDSPFRGRSDLRGEPWTGSDERELLHLRNELQHTWTEIALQFPGRPLANIKTKYYAMKARPSSAFSRQPFSEGEDTKLLDLKAKGLGWKEIAREFPARTPKSLSNRFFIVRARSRKSPGNETDLVCHEG